MMFFTKEEIRNRMLIILAKRGKEYDPISIHHNTKCKINSFMAVGPLYNGLLHAGQSWFDIRVTEKTYEMLSKTISDVCTELGMSFKV
jgi:hypothetical protein